MVPEYVLTSFHRRSIDKFFPTFSIGESYPEEILDYFFTTNKKNKFDNKLCYKAHDVDMIWTRVDELIHY